MQEEIASQRSKRKSAGTTGNASGGSGRTSSMSDALFAIGNSMVEAAKIGASSSSVFAEGGRAASASDLQQMSTNFLDTQERIIQRLDQSLQAQNQLNADMLNCSISSRQLQILCKANKNNASFTFLAKDNH